MKPDSNGFESLRGQTPSEPSSVRLPEPVDFSIPKDDTTNLAKQESEEVAQLEKFIEAYESKTGLRLVNLDRCQKGERPDFICERSDGVCIGIELTEVPPKHLLEFHRIFDPDRVMESQDLIEHMFNVVSKKERLRSKGDWRQSDEQILVITLESYKFDSLDWLSDLELQDEFSGTGFTEIWLCDNSTLSAHGASQLIGLFPASIWGLHRPTDFDPKPFG
jgi:hypothetical protein